MKTFRNYLKVSGYALLGVENACMLVQAVFGDILRKPDANWGDGKELLFLEEFSKEGTRLLNQKLGAFANITKCKIAVPETELKKKLIAEIQVIF